MVARDKFGARALLTPEYHAPHKPASGAVLADAMRNAYSYAQYQGRMIGTQTYNEDPNVQRTISSTALTLIARHYVHLPPYARRVRYQTNYRVFWHEEKTALVGHQLILTDEDANAAEGSIIYDERPTLPLSFSITPGTDSQQSSPGATGVFSVYDLPFSTSECSAEIAGLLDMADLIRIDLYAFATTLETSTTTAISSALASDVVTAEAPSTHPFVVGQRIWTDGFDIDIPRGSPVPITSATTSEIEWDLIASDDGDFGEGNIYSEVGFPLPYRPSPGGCWWEA